MAHTVNISIPKREIENSDVTFQVDKDDKPLGKLRVSKGGVDWIAAPGRTPVKKTWTQLAAMFAEASKGK